MALTPIVGLLTFIRSASRNDPDQQVALAIAVAYNQDSKLEADSEEEETILGLRVVRVEKDLSILVKEGSLRFLE